MPEELTPTSSPAKARTAPVSEDSRPNYVNTSDAVHTAQRSRESRDREAQAIPSPLEGKQRSDLKLKQRKARIASERSFQKLAPLAPDEVAAVRRSAYNIIAKQIPTVGKVLSGQKKWDAQQVRLFSIMLNKVMPDLHHSFNEVSIEDKSLTELSISDLESIVKQAALEEARANITEAITTIEDAEYAPYDPEAPSEAALLATPNMPAHLDEEISALTFSPLNPNHSTTEEDV